MASMVTRPRPDTQETAAIGMGDTAEEGTIGGNRVVFEVFIAFRILAEILLLVLLGGKEFRCVIQLSEDKRRENERAFAL